MKSTGVVRKIDDLGRIVIPKEIRKSLKINDGESLEIYVDHEVIALKKFSSMDKFEEMSLKLSETINHLLGHSVIITNTDKVVASFGNFNSNVNGEKIGSFLESILLAKKILVENDNKTLIFENIKFDDISYVITPIVSNKVSIGLVIILGYDKSISFEDEEVANVMAEFLSKCIDD